MVLSLALVRGEVRLGFLLYKSWGENMKGFKKWEKKAFKYPFTYGGIGTNKCGIGTKRVLPVFFLLVPVPVGVVPVPLCYYHFFLDGYRYQKCGTSITLQKFPKFSTF